MTLLDDRTATLKKALIAMGIAETPLRIPTQPGDDPQWAEAVLFILPWARLAITGVWVDDATRDPQAFEALVGYLAREHDDWHRRQEAAAVDEKETLRWLADMGQASCTWRVTTPSDGLPHRGFMCAHGVFIAMEEADVAMRGGPDASRAMRAELRYQHELSLAAGVDNVADLTD